MDTETSEVVERINARIDALEVTLRAEIRGESAAVRDELRAEIRGESAAIRDALGGEMSSMRDDLRGEMSSMRDDLRGEMSLMRDELRTEIRDSLEESKRHAQVLHESVRDDIRMLAEAFAARSTRLDSNQP